MTGTEIIKTQHLSCGDIRRMCIREDFYTQGTNEQYTHLLNNIVGEMNNPTDKDIFRIALNIAKHSSKNPYISETEFIEYIMYLVAQCVTTTYEISGLIDYTMD